LPGFIVSIASYVEENTSIVLTPGLIAKKVEPFSMTPEWDRSVDRRTAVV
jgi:hypothetical protein